MINSGLQIGSAYAGRVQCEWPGCHRQAVVGVPLPLGADFIFYCELHRRRQPAGKGPQMIDPADLQPAIDALTAAAQALQAASDIRQAKVDSDNADVLTRQAQIAADQADAALQQVAINTDATGIAAVNTTIAALQALITPTGSR